jgi:hypothetical protein
MRKTILGLTVIGAIAAPIAFASSASAAVAVDGAGHGFVGKGDVQTALGYNNSQMLANAGKLNFTTSQDATQAVTQALTQSGTQSGTQSAVQYGVELGKQSAEQVMTQTLSCTKTNGNNVQQVRTGTREGERTAERVGTAMGTREGVRTGTATGTRQGTQTGDLTGKLAATVAYDSRQRTQVTGFNLTGFATGDPKFVADGSPTYGTPSFDDYTFGAYKFSDYSFGAYEFQPYVWFGDFNFGATTWAEEFESDPNANPDLCVEGNNNIVPGSVKSIITEGAVTVSDDVTTLATLDGNIVDGKTTDGDITDEAISSGNTTPGAVTASGAPQVSVNGKAL